MGPGAAPSAMSAAVAAAPGVAASTGVAASSRMAASSGVAASSGTSAASGVTHEAMAAARRSTPDESSPKRRGPEPVGGKAATERGRPEGVTRKAAAEGTGPEVPARGGPPPTVAIPAEVRWPDHAKVRPRTEAPDPGCDDPGPALRRIVDVLVRLALSTGRHVRVSVAVGYPDPAILLGVDPLARLRGLRVGRLRLGRRGGRRGRHFGFRPLISLVCRPRPCGNQEQSQRRDKRSAGHSHCRVADGTRGPRAALLMRERA